MALNKKSFTEGMIVVLLEAIAAITFGNSEFTWMPMLFCGAAGAAIIALSFRYEVLKMIAKVLFALVVFLGSLQYVFVKRKPL